MIWWCPISKRYSQDEFWAFKAFEWLLKYVIGQKGNRKSMPSVLLPRVKSFVLFVCFLVIRWLEIRIQVVLFFYFLFLYPVWHHLIYMSLCLLVLKSSLWVSKWQRGRTNTLQKTYSPPMALKGLLFHSKYILSKSSQPTKFAHKRPCSSLFSLAVIKWHSVVSYIILSFNGEVAVRPLPGPHSTFHIR